MIYASDSDLLRELTITTNENLQMVISCSCKGPLKGQLGSSKTSRRNIWEYQRKHWDYSVRRYHIWKIAGDLEYFSAWDTAWICLSEKRVLFISLLFLVFPFFPLLYIWYLKSDHLIKSLGLLPNTFFCIETCFHLFLDSRAVEGLCSLLSSYYHCFNFLLSSAIYSQTYTSCNKGRKITCQ